MKENIPPEFDGVDEKGYYSSSPEGKFRSLDVQDGRLVWLRPKFHDRIFDTKGGDLDVYRPDRRHNEGRHNRRNS